jgi:cystathionine beta-lyase
MKTLALRLERQQASAARLAGFLARHPRVKKVYYPTLPDHPGRDVHFRQARGGGGVISFTTGSVEFSRRLVEATSLFATTVSFGGVGSSMSLPTHMSHASIPLEVRASRRFPEDLVRVSVGIEHPDDLLESLQRALDIANTNTNEKDGRPCTKHAY